MSIAAGASATNLKTVAGAENNGHKARSSAPGQVDALGGGGFLALLMSMDPQTDVGTDSVGATDQIAGLAPQAVMPEPTPTSLLLPSSSPQDAMAQNIQQDLSMLLAQAGAGGMGDGGATVQIAGLVLPPAPGAAPVSGAIMQLSNLPPTMAPNPQQSLTEPSAQVVAGGPGAVDPLAGLVPPTVMPDPSPAQPTPASNPPQSLAQSLQHALTTGADKAERAIEKTGFSMSEDTAGREGKVDPLLGQAEPLVPLRPSRGKGAELQARAGGSLLESRLSSSMEASSREPANLGALMNSGLGEGMLRQADRSATSPSTLFGGFGADGVWGQQGLHAGAGTDLSAATPDSSMSSLESMVADTVSYWVAQGVQNAELKLDGLGPDPVDVSISLKGDEAQIDFRTDQPEMRQVLEGATAHLKDLLAKEGLVLSGVSVGSSSQHGAGAQEQRHRQSARQAGIARVEVAPTEPRLRAIQSQAGAVDIFV